MDFTDCGHLEATPRPLVPGGKVGLDDVIGRDSVVEKVQRALEGQQGAVLLGDRRIGKTTILNLLASIWQQVGHEVIFFSAQTTAINQVANNLREQLDKKSWFRRERERWGLDVRISQAGFTLTRTGGTGAQADPPYQEDLLGWIARTHSDKKVILMIDEIAEGLSAMRDTDAATEFMMSMRRLREQHDNVYVILAGSLGLHHVVPSMSTIRGLRQVVVGPLEACDGLQLALDLLATAGYEGDEARPLAEAVTRAAHGIPFYIQWIVSKMDEAGNFDRPAREWLTEALHDPLDPLDIAHYDVRLDKYLGDRAPVARLMLDSLALDGPQSVNQLLDGLAVAETNPRPTRDDVLHIVQALERDQFLRSSSDGVDFANPLLREMWLVHRRLNP